MFHCRAANLQTILLPSLKSYRVFHHEMTGQDILVLRRIPGPGISLLRESITGHLRSGLFPTSPAYRVPGPVGFKLPVYVIHWVVYLFLVPGMVGTTSVIKEVDPNLLLSLIQMNLVQLDIILYQALLGPGPGIGLEDILGKRNLIAIGLILEIPIDGNIKDVLGLVHIMTGDLDIVRLEAGSYHTHVISVIVLVGLPIFKKRGDGFLALLLLIRMLFQTSYQGLLQIMSLKEKALLLLFRSLSQPLHIGLRTNLLLIGFLRVVLSILRKKMTEKSLTLRPLKNFLIFFPRLFVLGKMIHQFLLNPGQALIFLILQRIKNHHLYPSPN